MPYHSALFGLFDGLKSLNTVSIERAGISLGQGHRRHQPTFSFTPKVNMEINLSTTSFSLPASSCPPPSAPIRSLTTLWGNLPPELGNPVRLAFLFLCCTVTSPCVQVASEVVFFCFFRFGQDFAVGVRTTREQIFDAHLCKRVGRGRSGRRAGTPAGSVPTA